MTQPAGPPPGWGQPPGPPPGWGQPPGPPPGWGQPPGPPPGWGQPGPWGYAPPPPVRRPADPWAVVALVTAALGMVPVAVGAGITALVRLRKRDARGHGLVAGAFALSAAWVLLVGLVAVLAASIPWSELEDPGEQAVTSLGPVAGAGPATVGTCLSKPEDGVGTPVDCDGSHEAEVYVVLSVRDSGFPGAGDLDAEADDACYRPFEDYVGADFQDTPYDYAWFAPTATEWNQGERRIVCVAVRGTADGLSGSVRDSGASGGVSA